ncbi:protein FAM184B isoform 2-T2 [Pelodytes ibericus]
MASGKNQQPGTYNGSKACQLVSQEYTHELHVKMCKKIAQLTKVIYTLNHKIDEYEVNILALKEAHQDEIDLISTETKEKCLQNEMKVGEEESLRSRIRNLEEALEKNNVIKEQTLADITIYKMQTEERELKAKAEHDEKVSALSKEMLSMKNDFEGHLQKLNEEADSLRKQCGTLGKEDLNEKLNKEVQTLNKEVESLKSQNKMITEEYTRKISKLHSSYSKERENLRKALQQSVTEMIQQLQQQEQEQKRSIQAKETTMLQEVKELKADIEKKTQDILQIKKQCHNMKETVQDLEVQLSKKGQEVMESKVKQTQLEEELSVTKKRLLLQEEEIHNQTEQIKTMSSTHNANNTEVAELKRQSKKHQQRTSIECCTNEKDNGDVLNFKQEQGSQNNIKVQNNELDESKREMSRLEVENSVLKDGVESLSQEMSILNQEIVSLKEKQNNIPEELILKQKMELDGIRQSHQEEIHTMVSNFSSAQAFLQAKIASLEAELKEMENKSAKQPRTEDLKLINCLRDKITYKDQVIKHLLELQNYDNEDVLPLNPETHRSQSFSCNPNAGSLTPTLKQKKKICEIPTRVISVPNLAAYEKNLLNHDAMAKKTMNPMRNSPSLDQSVKHGYPFKQPAQLLDIIRPNRRIHSNLPTKTDSKDQEPKRPEWFTKYFSF